MHAKFKKHKDNYEVNVFYNEKSKSIYHNLITRDPNTIAQVLLDLMVHGFPIEKALKIFEDRIRKHDWMGV